MATDTFNRYAPDKSKLIQIFAYVQTSHSDVMLKP
jgi:hypothetical protein